MAGVGRSHTVVVLHSVVPSWGNHISVILPRMWMSLWTERSEAAGNSTTARPTQRSSGLCRWLREAVRRTALCAASAPAHGHDEADHHDRSEERRVGKERSWRRW